MKEPLSTMNPSSSGPQAVPNHAWNAREGAPCIVHQSCSIQCRGASPLAHCSDARSRSRHEATGAHSWASERSLETTPTVMAYLPSWLGGACITGKQQMLAQAMLPIRNGSDAQPGQAHGPCLNAYRRHFNPHLQCQAWPFTSVIPHLCICLCIMAAFSVLHAIGIGIGDISRI